MYTVDPAWVRDQATDLGRHVGRVLSPGDTGSDGPVLEATGQAVSVGDRLPDGLDGVRHVPGVSFHEVGAAVLEGWRVRGESGRSVDRASLPRRGREVV